VISAVAAAIGLNAHRLALRVERRQRSAKLTVHSHRPLRDRSGFEVTLANAGAADARHCGLTLTDADGRRVGNVPARGGPHIAAHERDALDVMLKVPHPTYPLHIDLSWADDPDDDAPRHQRPSEHAIDEPPRAGRPSRWPFRRHAT
jgi:hypothetical protein